LLVVVLVVSVLVAILLPTLAGAIRSGRAAASMSNLRQIGIVLGLYAEGEGAFPMAVLDEYGETSFYPFACEGGRIGVTHWQIVHAWPAVVAPYAPWDEYREVFVAPSSDRERETCGWPASYLYSASFIARPETWTDGTTPDSALLDSASPNEVVFPSTKVLSWEWELPYLGKPFPVIGRDIARPTPMLFADNHVDQKTPALAADPARNVFDPLTGTAGMRLHNTPSGVRGRDY